MSFSPNFVNVTLRVNAKGKQSLVVQGVTAGDPDEVQAIYVGLAHGNANFVAPAQGDAAGPNAPVELQPQGAIKAAASAKTPNGDSWKATITSVDPNVAAHEKVLVIGVAVPTSTRKRPFFWHQTLTIGP
jgi:hypothetical protein